jgi:CBS domain-containing protein
MTALNIMTPNPITVSLDKPLSHAAKLMTDHGISGLPVVNSEGRIRGIVTKTDIIRAMAE